MNKFFLPGTDEEELTERSACLPEVAIERASIGLSPFCDRDLNSVLECSLPCTKERRSSPEKSFVEKQSSLPPRGVSKASSSKSKRKISQHEGHKEEDFSHRQV